MRIIVLFFLIPCASLSQSHQSWSQEMVRRQIELAGATSNPDSGAVLLHNWLDDMPGPQTTDDSIAWFEAWLELTVKYLHAFQLDSARQILDRLSAHAPSGSEKLKVEAGGIRSALLLRTGEYAEMQKVLEETLDFVGTHAVEPMTELRLMINLGIAYKEQGFLDLALGQFARTESFMSQNDLENDRSKFILHYSVAGCYSEMGDWDQYVLHMRRAHAINVRMYGRDHPATANSLNSIANGFKQSGHTERALETYYEALAIYNKTVRPDYPQKSVVQLNIGETLQDLGRHEEAYTYLRTAADSRLLNYGHLHPRTARVYKALAGSLAALHRYEAAFAVMDTALMGLGYDPSSPIPYSGVDDMFALYYTLADRAALHARRAANQPTLEHELKALDAYEKGIEVLNDIRLHYKGRLARSNLNRKSYQYYEPAIDLCFDLYTRTGDLGYIERAFFMTDESKDNDFYAYVQHREAGLRGIIPDSVRSKDSVYQSQLSSLESRWYESRDKGDSVLLAIESELAGRKNAYFSFLDELEERYPAYHALLHAPRHKDLGTLQSQLKKKNSTLVEFFVGDSLGFAFLVGDDHIQGHRLVRADTLETVVLALLKAINGNTLDESYASVSSRLFELLFDHLSLPEPQRGLVAVMDGILSYVPVEMLDPGEDMLLIERYPVTYCSSATAWLQWKEHAGASKWLGIAPEYAGVQSMALASRALDSMYLTATREGWIALPGAAREVETIGALVGGEKWMGNEATEGRFKKEAGDFDILHLSMHAWMDDDEPMQSALIFTAEDDRKEDQALYAHEIMRLRLPATMAVLSACNTGLGTPRRGEGMHSIARAFHYAGVQSTVMSLWKVPDESTAIIMEEFYRQLRGGERPDAALQQAKLSYLQNAGEPELKHPYYWAGFVLHGTNQPVYARSFPVVWIFSGVALIAIALGYWRYRRSLS